MDNPAKKFHRCIHQIIRWTMKISCVDVFDAQFRYSLGYCFVFGLLLTAIIGCGCPIFTSEDPQAQVYAAACAMTFLQVISLPLCKRIMSSLTKLCHPIQFSDIIQIHRR